MSALLVIYGTFLNQNGNPGALGCRFGFWATGGRWVLASRCAGEFRLAKHRNYLDDFVSGRSRSAFRRDAR
jgi:hypothetical protein